MSYLRNCFWSIFFFWRSATHGDPFAAVNSVGWETALPHVYPEISSSLIGHESIPYRYGWTECEIQVRSVHLGTFFFERGMNAELPTPVEVLWAFSIRSRARSSEVGAILYVSLACRVFSMTSSPISCSALLCRPQSRSWQKNLGCL